MYVNSIGAIPKNARRGHVGPLKVELDGCGLLGTELRSSVKVASQLLSSLYGPSTCVEVCEFFSRRRRNGLKIIKAKICMHSCMNDSYQRANVSSPPFTQPNIIPHRKYLPTHCKTDIILTVQIFYCNSALFMQSHRTKA